MSFTRLSIQTRCISSQWTRAEIPRRTLANYSTQIKKTAGPFTPNKLITESVGDTSANINRTLVYIGPFTETIRRYKTTASLFGVCGICAVPALLSTGEAPIMSVVLAGVSAITPIGFVHWYTKDYVTRLIVHDDVKTVEKQRKKPQEIKDKWVGLEKVGLMGFVREQTVRLSDLTDKSTPKAVMWEAKGKKFALERDVMNTDPFLNGLVNFIKKKSV
ncbi:hypothetical protein PHYBLDRAFT_179036 [Phycomyces blakesleeanus NRRL 1555(-)]|uniref:Uncharacterized protein n=1 Tax=Phycomyces blakesleeanus (strain ATCC 8743b / DSM 1359 / FGSC 10004 / NBRC 33097 / NRRL 1555) TaxID=763407 RepID=A0A163BAH3_PHYB8|nr:hypothetical protein PHYBLDRAFT_179036 [Phycomyces blakesleeanus NRRL 1555(-)]OAD79241.1 hypothetical protein PHYBLDRAFT_179036 [Phycomyces blakesleeanus NRRL 1555(-)]|eukprot:XP_018297281.1 hypothetical protein PHYBLDRAFT_179036 [Phycomyces blakesleeanus NRRL 1555(-)]